MLSYCLPVKQAAYYLFLVLFQFTVYVIVNLFLKSKSSHSRQPINAKIILKDRLNGFLHESW